MKVWRLHRLLVVSTLLLLSLSVTAQFPQSEPQGAVFRPSFDTAQSSANRPFVGLEACTSTATTICLGDNRFAVSATWRTTNGQTGSAQATRLTSDTGYFSFFNASNVEAVVKVLNSCSFNSRFWVFAAGLTDVNVVLTVRDTVTGTVKTYTNPLGTAFQPIQDTSAFATCSAGGTSFVSGNTTQVGSQNIGASGGTMTLAAPGTALDGAKITFPTGALSANASVKVSLNRGTVTPVAGTFSGAAVDLNITGASTTFSQPVSITLRNTGPANTVPVPYFVDSGGKLRPGQLIAVDRQAGTFTFQTFHASLYTWLFGSTAAPIDPVSTAFTPANDGFQVVNYGSTVRREGECFGMTAFALWYFLNQRSLGAFYPRYMTVVGTDSSSQPLRGQNVIATRAFTSIAQKWTSYTPEVVRQQRLTAADRFGSIRNAIANTAAPVLIYLYHSDGSADAHSVLAYAIDATGKISIYDPNVPNTVKTAQYSTASSSFSPYCNDKCYDGIVYNGDGSLILNEPYSNILADAQNNFNNSGGATIDINSHTNGQAVTSRFATLAGVVHSGQVLVTRLTVLVNSAEYSSEVSTSGAYSIPVALVDGVNYIHFRTEGKDANSNLRTTSNNYDTQDFTLRAVVPSSVILMTLTWDKDDTDLDTYVIDPNGDYSAYYHKLTADGGELDRDVISGYGPEHWTLTNTDTIRYGQPYKFRVHYYSDHGNGPTNYTVTIELYNGTARQTTYSYSGALSAHSTGNDGPVDIGADWANIATIIPTQSSSVAPVVQTAPDGSMIITVPMPSPQERQKLKQ
jgi:uncharacterized protein YfaP (DUF2135 family)